MVQPAWFQRKKILCGLLLTCLLAILAYTIATACSKDSPHLLRTLDQLQLQVVQMQQKMSQLAVKHQKQQQMFQRFTKPDPKQPMLYLITPTYARFTQKADLTRLMQTLMHVHNLHWILIEDSPLKTPLVSALLARSGLAYTHLHVSTQSSLKMKSNDPHWLKHRGVDQRNEGIAWLHKNQPSARQAVVYFADDDNTYSLDLFDEIRPTKVVSMWPVALVGGLRWEGPICANGKVEDFFTAWKPDRDFAIDMAGFAFNAALLHKYPDARFDAEYERGFLESNFLAKQLHVTRDQIEARGNNCREILVWHTQTKVPSMKQEDKLKRFGISSDMTIEI